MRRVLNPARAYAALDFDFSLSPKNWLFTSQFAGVCLMRTKRMIHRLSLAIVTSVYAIGCGGSGAVGDNQVRVVPVSGKLYLDGDPHGPATLSLMPTGGEGAGSGTDRPQVGGAVKADGSFTLSTYADGDGAAPGEYQVTLAGYSDPGSMEASLAAMSGEVSGPDAQPLTITIPEGGSTALELKFTSISSEKPKQQTGTPGPLGTN
jgi:hypothetical protein